MKDFTIKKLPNGIDVYYYSDKNLKRVYASVNIKYGTNGYYDKFIYNNKKYHVKPAMAHFLEHYLIETSKNGNMLFRYRDKSYETNGLTYSDLTTYYFIGIDSLKNIKESIKELLEMVEEPVFNNKNVEKTKAAICSELTSMDDNRYQIARSNNRHNSHLVYDSVPVDNNVLGSIETTNNITLSEVRTCYNAYYNDENKFIVIAGNIDINNIHKLLEDYYNGLAPHRCNMKDYPYGLDIGVRTKLEIIEKPCDASLVESSFKMKILEEFSMGEQSLYMNMYMRIKLSTDSKAIDQLIRDKYLINWVDYSSDYFKGTCETNISYESHKPKKALKKLEAILNDKKVSKKEFELIKKDNIVSEIKGLNNMYYLFKRFPTIIDFTPTSVDAIEEMSSITYKRFKEFISKVDFKFETTTIITKKRIRK